MPDSTGSGPLRPGALRTLPVSVCVPFTELVHMAQCPPDSVAAPEEPLRAGWSGAQVPTRACDWCRKWGRGGPAGLSPEPLGSAPTPGSGSRGQTKLLDALPASRSWLRAGKPSPRSREEERAGRGQPGAGAAAHSPHPAVGFAVGRVYADGALAVLHRPGVVAQLAVGRGSAETAGGRPCVLASGRAGPRGDRPRRPHTRPAGG